MSCTTGVCYDASKSAQPCGCDEGANYVAPTCHIHRREPMSEWDDFRPEPFVVVKGRVITANDVAEGLKETQNVPTLLDERAPNRCTTLPTDPAERKKYPVASGFLDYFPDAVVAVAHVSWVGNNQHNPGQPLHWARGKSMDQEDTSMRHYLERGGGNVPSVTGYDSDGVLHSAKRAWRAMAALQLEIEQLQREGKLR